MKPMKDENAVSEVIGAIILIAIMAMVAAVVIITIETGPSANVQEQAIILNSEYRIEDDLLVISHKGGETLEKADIQILVDGIDHTDDFVDDTGSAFWTEWKAGENRYYTSTAIPLGVQVIGTNPGYGDVLVYSSGDISPLQTVTTATPVPTGTVTPTPTPTAQPDANFTATPLIGQAPLLVQFTDLTNNTPTSWLWNFGDMATSTAQHPQHTYWYAGNYSVSLYVENAAGNDTLTKNDYITALPYVIRVNTGGPQYTDTNGNVWLADQSYSLGSWGYITRTGAATVDAPINGTIDDTLYQSETYYNGDLEYRFSNVPDGIYNVTLKFAEIYTGITGAGQRVFDIEVENPTPQITGFDIYSLVGRDAAYDVSLNVTVTDGELNIFFLQDVENPKISAIEISTQWYNGTQPGYPPVADFTANVTSGTAPLSVLFTDLTTNSPTSWSWTFGDGGTSTDQNPVHTYAAAGNYTVTLNATNAYGSDVETKTAYVTVTSTPVTPVANFTANVTSGTAPLSVLFTDATTNSPMSWSWTFGDGGMSTDQNPVHTYTAAGNYTVTLTATNVYGSDNETKTEYINVSSAGPTLHDVILNGRTYTLGDGGTFGFDVTGSGSYIKYRRGSIRTYSFPLGSTVEIVLNGAQSGSLYMTSASISTLTLPSASFYVNGNLIQSNREITGIWVSGYDSFTSDVVLTAPNSGSSSQFTVDGVVIYDWWPIETPGIILNDVQPDSNGILNLNGGNYVIAGVTSYSTF